ncbi:MAG: hypothetical protein HDS10_05205 [Bacteroides sp.]|nr:hypothetical protein [Bacteroides sp.]
MKKLLFIITILFIGIFAFSCGDSVSTPILLEAERLAETDPDSALSILDTLTSSHLRGSDEIMLRRLLILEAKDKKFIPHKDDSEINALLDYFIGGNNLPRIHPLVYYYAGRVNSDLNNDAKALAYYRKALDELPKCKIPSLESRIRAQRAYLYRNHKLFQHSIRELKVFLKIARQNKDTVDIINGNLDIAHVYGWKNQKDSAKYIYDSIENLVKEYGDSVIITNFYYQLGGLYYYSGEYAKADSVINAHPIKTTEITAEYINFIKNKINQQLHKPVSAEHYAVLLKNHHPGYRYSGNFGLAKIAMDNDNPEEALKYISGAYEDLQQMQRMYSENSLAEMEKIIDESELESKNLRLENENREKRLYIIICSVIVVAISLAVVLVRRRAYLAKIRNDLKVESIKNEDNRRARDLKKKIKESEARAAELKRQIDEFEAAIALENIIDEITDLISSPPAHPTEDHIRRLKKAFARTYPDFIAALDALNLTEALYTDALLTRIHIPTKCCADILGFSPQSVYSARNRFLKRIANGEKPKNWSEFIQSL